MKVFVSYSHHDKELAIKLVKKLKENDFDVLGDFDLMVGEDVAKKLNRDLLQADAVVFLVTSAFNNSYAAKKELISAFSYYTARNKPRLIPVLFEGGEMPVDLRDVLYLNANNNYEDVLTRLLANLVILRDEQESSQKDKEERKEVFEISLANYIDKAMKKLEINEKRNKILSYTCYIISALLIGIAIVFSLYKTKMVFNLNMWELSVSEVVSGILTLTLILALSRLLFVLGKSFMVESIRNSDRIHAISFGEFFLNAYGSVATRDEVREVFGNWNIDNGSSFITQSPRDYDPQIVENMINAISALKK